jgi:hypothetical protein
VCEEAVKLNEKKEKRDRVEERLLGLKLTAFQVALATGSDVLKRKGSRRLNKLLTCSNEVGFGATEWYED